MSSLVALSNVLHFVIAILSAAGAWLLPVRYMPAVIGLTTGVLFRYHDYCWMMRFTSMIAEFMGDPIFKDMRKNEDFILRLCESFGLARMQQLIEHNRPLITNFATTVLAMNINYALYRLSIQYNFKLLPCNLTKFICFSMLIMWFITEFALFYFETHVDTPPLQEIYQVTPVAHLVSYPVYQTHC